MISPGCVGQVQEGVRNLGRQVGEAAFIELEELVADPDLEAPAQDVDRLLLLVVDVQRGPPCGATSTVK